MAGKTSSRLPSLMPIFQTGFAITPFEEESNRAFGCMQFITEGLFGVGAPPMPDAAHASIKSCVEELRIMLQEIDSQYRSVEVSLMMLYGGMVHRDLSFEDMSILQKTLSDPDVSPDMRERSVDEILHQTQEMVDLLETMKIANNAITKFWSSVMTFTTHAKLLIIEAFLMREGRSTANVEQIEKTYEEQWGAVVRQNIRNERLGRASAHVIEVATAEVMESKALAESAQRSVNVIVALDNEEVVHRELSKKAQAVAMTQKQKQKQKQIDRNEKEAQAKERKESKVKKLALDEIARRERQAKEDADRTARMKAEEERSRQELIMKFEEESAKELGVEAIVDEQLRKRRKNRKKKTAVMELDDKAVVVHSEQIVPDEDVPDPIVTDQSVNRSDVVVVSALPSSTNPYCIASALSAFIYHIDEQSALQLKSLEDAFFRIRAHIKEFLPSAVVHSVGSMSTGLNLPAPDSDIDIMITTERVHTDTDEDEERKRVKHEMRSSLADALRLRYDPNAVEYLPSAKIPVITITDVEHLSIKIDLTFDVPFVLSAKAFFLDAKQLYPKHFRPLTLYLKRFLSRRGLHKPWKGGVGSFLLQLLVLSHLQYDFGGSCAEGPAECLVSFFNYFGYHFDVDRFGISVLHGGVLFPKRSRGYCPITPGVLCVENPLNPAVDVGGGAFKFAEVRAAFRYAFDRLSADPKSFNSITMLDG